MEQAGPLGAGQSEDRLLYTLTEAMHQLEAVSLLRSPCGRGTSGRRRPGEGPHEEDEDNRGVAAATGAERRCMLKVLLVLKELGTSHAVRAAAWRDALRECANMLENRPPGGSKHQHQPTKGTESFLMATTDSFSLKLLKIIQCNFKFEHV